MWDLQEKNECTQAKSGKKTVFYFSCNRFREFTTEKCGTSITEATLEKLLKKPLIPLFQITVKAIRFT